MARLLFEDGERGPLEIGPECAIGRDADNAVVLSDDATVSRQHARIRMRNGDLMLTDLGTRNGTFLERGGDRQRVTELALHDGDLIIVGATRMRVELDPSSHETRILEQGLTQVPGATRAGQILPGVPPGRLLGGPADEREALTKAKDAPATRRPSWIRRLLGRG